MKKLIIIIAMMLLSFGASAQIAKVKTTEAVTTIATLRYGVCSLKMQEGVYYIGLQSSNQFDDPFLFHLGEGRESALQTLLDLQELFKGMKKGEFAEFSIFIHLHEYTYKIHKTSRTSFSFYDTGLAGNVWMSNGELDTLIDRFTSFEFE